MNRTARSRIDPTRRSQGRPPDPPHRCHARGCTTEVAARLLMCRKHWRMVPRDLQRGVWAHYVDGQEVRKDPTPEYLEAADRAIDAVAEKEAALA